MGLDVATPDPPRLETGFDAEAYEDADVAADLDDYRREELQAFLDEGAWERAFGEWTEHAEMDAEDWAIVRDLGLVSEFWDLTAQIDGYSTPQIRNRVDRPGLRIPSPTRYTRLSARHTRSAPIP